MSRTFTDQHTMPMQGFRGAAQGQSMPTSSSTDPFHASFGPHQGAYDDDAFDPAPYDYAPHQPYETPSPYNVDRERSYYRPPPPSGPPPAYYRVLNRTYAGSLRPIVLLTCFLSLCYLLLLGIEDFKTAGMRDISGKYKTFTVVQGVLFMAAAGIEVFGLFSTYTQRLMLARLYSWMSLIAYAATIASQILAVIVLFTLKSDVIASCSTYYQGNNVNNPGSFWDDNANNVPLSAADANTYCQQLWSRSRTWDIIWLIVTVLIGAIFVMFGFAYAHQLTDPSSVRSKVPASARFAGQQQQHSRYGNAAPYDDPATHYSYPPPPLPPTLTDRNGGNIQQAFDAPPLYEGRPSLDDHDLDSKEDAKSFGHGAEANHLQYEYERDARPVNRPGSSRGVWPSDDEERARRESGETLRGESSSTTAKEFVHGSSKTDEHGGKDEDDTHRV